MHFFDEKCIKIRIKVTIKPKQKELEKLHPTPLNTLRMSTQSVEKDY